MSPLVHLSVLFADWRKRRARAVLRHRVIARHPTLHCDPTAILDYAFDDIDGFELGEDVVFGAFTEIVVYRRSRYSSVPGRLIVGDRSAIQSGANVRAAGGCIRIGRASVVGQHAILIAANHLVERGTPYFFGPWDETRTGIEIGDNVWVGAGSVLLPGSHIGNDAVVAAGSVVTRDIPAGEIWGGVPARYIKAVPERAPASHTARTQPTGEP